MISQEVKLVPHAAKYIAAPSLIKRETSGVLPQPERLAEICFTKASTISVVIVVSTAALESTFIMAVDQTKKWDLRMICYPIRRFYKNAIRDKDNLREIFDRNEREHCILEHHLQSQYYHNETTFVE